MTKPWQYRRVYTHGRRLRGDHFSLIYLANDAGENRLGISVHGVKSSVRRHRLKRIVREFYRHHRSFLSWGGKPEKQPSPGMDVVFAIRTGFAPDSPQAVQDAVQALLERRRRTRSEPLGGVTEGRARGS